MFVLFITKFLIIILSKASNTVHTLVGQRIYLKGAFNTKTTYRDNINK